MDDSKKRGDPLPHVDDETFEAVRRRLELPLPTDDVRESAKRRGMAYPESSLERHHPHVVEKLVLLWGHPECEKFLDSLIIDGRGDRDGFRRDVMEELFFLHAIVPRVATASHPWQEGDHLR